jgi:membrane fusion protein (multidrug efflux system)
MSTLNTPRLDGVGPTGPRRKSQPNPALRFAVVLLASVLVLGAVFGWGALKAHFIAQFLKGFANQVQTVATITAPTSTWQPQLTATGSITPVEGASLSSEVGGIVDTVRIPSGEDVKAGTVLVTLRPNGDPAVLAQLQAQEQLAAITEARDEKQLAAKAIAQAQLDADRATLAADKAQVQAQQALIAEKIIRAPFAGRVGIRQVTPGQFIPAGTAVVSLEQLDPVYTDFYVPQQEVSDVAPGQTVAVTVDAFPGQSFTGTVIALDAAVDPATRNILVRASVANPARTLRPGMFANVAVASGAAQSYVTLPQTAITYNPYGDTVYVVQHGKDAKGQPALVAQQIFVTTGDTRGDQVAIISGVKPGDVVVTAGQVKLHNGAVVDINNTVQPSDSAIPTPPNE